jgi:hypothetical protein
MCVKLDCMICGKPKCEIPIRCILARKIIRRLLEKPEIIDQLIERLESSGLERR